MDQDVDAGTMALRQAMRQAREAAHLSLGKLAEKTFVSKSHLGNIETGTRPVQIEVVQAYDEAIGTGGTLTALFYAVKEDDEVRRRALVGLLGLMSGAAVPARSTLAEYARASLLDAFGADDWAETTAEYGRRFMTDDPLALRKSLTGDLVVLRHAMDAKAESAGRNAAPRLMTVYGMLAANAGDVATAARWYRGARIAADQLGDNALRQWVRGREAFRRGYEGADPGEVLATAADVEDVEAHLATAQAFARLGESTRALEALEDARHTHDAGDQSETTIYAMAPWRMSLSVAYVFALLGDVRRCEDELAMVAPPRAVKRWEAQLQIQRAVALSRSGDITTGLNMANEVVRETPSVERGVVLLQMQREASTRPNRSPHAS